jgi:hypothetical protein
MTGIKISIDPDCRSAITSSSRSAGRITRFCFPSFLIKSQEEVELIRRLGLKQVIIFPDKSSSPPKPIQANPSGEIPTEEAQHSEMESKLAAEKERRIGSSNSTAAICSRSE